MQKNKKKLLIVIKNIDGGTGTFLFQLLKLSNVYDIKVCALERRRFGSDKFYKDIYYFTKKYSKVNRYTLNPILYWHIIKEVLWLKSILKKEKFDIILSIDTHCNIVASLAIYFFGIQAKVIITTHNNLSLVAKKKAFLIRGILKVMGKFLFKRMDYIICNSQGVANDFKKFFNINKTVIVIPYGLDLVNIKKQSSKNISKEYAEIYRKDDKKIISIGRFEEQKDFKTLIHAFSSVSEKTKKVSLILIGDGSQKEELQNLVKKLKIENAVRFLGWQENIYPYLKKSDLFILSSHFEGFGYVIIEAMSQGIPVISTDSPFGPREIIGNDEYGLLIDVGDEQKMTKAIIKMLKSKGINEYYKRKSLERVKVYEEKKMIDSYVEIFKKM